MSQITPSAIDPILDPAVHARRWQILGVMCLSLLVVMLANTSMNVALPILSGALGATSIEPRPDASLFIERNGDAVRPRAIRCRRLDPWPSEPPAGETGHLV